jgi:hypothetical protein
MLDDFIDGVEVAGALDVRDDENDGVDRADVLAARLSPRTESERRSV